MARPFVSRFLQLQRSHLCHHRGLATSTSPIIRYHTQKPLPLPLPLPRTPTPSTTVRHASSQRDRDREVRDSSNDSAVNDDARFATDLEALDFYADVPAPATSVEACLADGFVLNNGARIEGGDGCVLVDGEAFRWRPWLCGGGGGGAMLNGKGQFEVPEEAWGLFKLLWPKPDLLIIGLGPSIHPISPRTKEFLATLGMRVDVQDSRNAAAQYNLLATERGPRDVAAALIPLNR